jgi:glycine cleavage system regulatory protein
VAPARIDLVLTIIGPDRPGLVELVSKTVAEHQGNWESSRMARMAGRFAGILQVSVPDEHADRLVAGLGALESNDLRVVVERAAADAAAPVAGPGQLLRVELVGNDRPGVIRDVSAALAHRGINVELLATECSAAPMTGGMLLKVTAQVRAPVDLPIASLRHVLEERASDFMVEVVRLGEESSAGKGDPSA